MEDSNKAIASKARRERKRRLVRHNIGIDIDDEAGESLTLGDLGEEEKSEERPFDHGYKIEPFNVRKELRDGVFETITSNVSHRSLRKTSHESENSNQTDSDDSSLSDGDVWLQTIQEQGEKAYANVRVAPSEPHTTEPLDRRTLLFRLADALLEEETPLQALRRLKGHVNSSKRIKLSDPATAQAQFDQIVEIADLLTTSSVDVDVYSETKEELFQRALLVKPDNVATTRPQWEYCWNSTDAATNAHGPYSADQMYLWCQNGYFVQHPMAAFRQVGEKKWILFSDQPQFNFIIQ